MLVCKIFVAAKVLWWIFLKSTYPEQHEISEIELYVVFLIFDTWISKVGTENLD